MSGVGVKGADRVVAIDAVVREVGDTWAEPEPTLDALGVGVGSTDSEAAPVRDMVPVGMGVSEGGGEGDNSEVVLTRSEMERLGERDALPEG